MNCGRLACILGFLRVAVNDVTGQTGADVNDIRKEIFTTREYNKHTRPKDNQSTPLEVNIDFALYGINEFDMVTERLITTGYLYMQWTDEFLMWNSSLYGDVSEILVPQTDIWTPDITLMNAISDIKGLGNAFFLTRITSSGRVTWSPFQIFQTTCKVDITLFPFDKQTCKLTFATWMHSNTELSLRKGGKDVDLFEFDSNGEWDVINTEASQSLVVVEYSITMKRRPLFYILNVILPIILLSLLNVLVFILPCESGEKASFSITVFLAFAVFLTIVASSLPQNSEKVSIMGAYIVLQSLTSTTIVVITTSQIRLFNSDPQGAIPSCLTCVVRLARCLTCLGCCYNKIRPTKSEDESSSEVEWKHVVNAMDFLFFWIFFFTTSITTVTCFFIAAFQ